MIPIPHLSYTISKRGYLFIRLDGNDYYDRAKAAQLRKELSELNPAFKIFWLIKLEECHYVEGVVCMKLEDELHSIMMEMELNDMGIFPWRCYLDSVRKTDNEEDRGDA